MDTKRIFPILGLVVIVLVAGGYWYLTNRSEDLSKAMINHVLTIESPEPDSYAEFGFFSIYIDEQYIIVGEHKAGKAYLFDHNGNLINTFHSPDPQSGGRFGMSVGISNDVIYIGAHHERVEGEFEAGQLHIFNVEGDYITTILSPEPDTYSGRFGRSQVLVEDTLIVTEKGAEVGAVTDAGKVFLFDLDGNYLSTLHSPEPEGYAEFGWSLAASSDHIVVGEHWANVDEYEDAGKVQVFDINGMYILTLKPPEPQTYGYFGTSVAVDDDLIVVGELMNVGSLTRAGKVHVFTLDGTFLMTIISPTPEAHSFFGGVVALCEDISLIGENGADGDSEDEGRVHVYDKEGNYLETLHAPETAEDSEYGAYVYSGGEWIAVFERGSEGGKHAAGKVYLYKLGT